MSRIPRSKIAIGKKHKKKFGEKNLIKQEKMVFESICDKHCIRKLDLCRSALLAEPNGRITRISYANMIGNMKASILIFTDVQLIIESFPDKIYDLIQIDQDKKMREKAKIVDDFTKTKEHMDTLKNSNQPNLEDNIDALSSEKTSHTTIMNMLDSQMKSVVSEEKVSEEKVSEEKVSEEKVSEEKVSEEKVSEEKVSEEKVSEEKVSEEKVSE